MSFRSATLYLWAVAFKAGALVGFVPVRWRGRHALAVPLVALLTSFIFIRVPPRMFFVVTKHGSAQTLAWLVVFVGSESLAFGSQRHSLALLLNCLRQYLDVHPLHPRHWRAFFLGTAIILVWVVAAHTSSSKTHNDPIAVALTPVVAALRTLAFTSMCCRLQCPLALLGAAAADLRVECIQKLQAAIKARRPLDRLTWRALRQRQFLLHDMLRKTSDVNGPCLLHIMIDMFLKVTPILDEAFTGYNLDDLDLTSMGNIISHFLLIMFVSLATFDWPAVEFQAMAEDLKALIKENRYLAFEFSMGSELQQLLTSEKEQQDNRIQLLGIFYCNRNTVTEMLCSVSLYVFTRVVKELY